MTLVSACYGTPIVDNASVVATSDRDLIQEGNVATATTTEQHTTKNQLNDSSSHSVKHSTITTKVEMEKQNYDQQHQLERELQSTICSGSTFRCEKLGKDGRWMRRNIGDIWCREECVYPNWQGVRRRFGWRCGLCN